MDFKKPALKASDELCSAFKSSVSPPKFMTDRFYINELSELSKLSLSISGEGPMVSVSRRMKRDDFEKNWFFKDCDRTRAELYLKGREVASFVVRPSRKVGCYCVSYIDQHSNFQHELIYEMFPGYSLDPDCDGVYEEGWFCDISSLIETQKDKYRIGVNRNEVGLPIESESDEVATTSMVVEDIVRRMRKGSKSLKSVKWLLEIKEMPGNLPRHELEQGTLTMYGNIQYCVPFLLPLLSSHVEKLSSGLQSSEVQTTSLILNGYYGANGKYFTAVIDDEQAVELARGLDCNQSLETLDLSNNRISEKGASALARTFSRSALQNITLDKNFIHTEGLIQLAEAFSGSPAFKTFRFRGQLKQVPGQGANYYNSPFYTEIQKIIQSSLERRSECCLRNSQRMVSGFFTQQEVEDKLFQQFKILRSNLYCLYLTKERCCVVHLALLYVSKSKKMKVIHHPIYRVRGGFMIPKKKGEELGVPAQNTIYLPTLAESCRWSLNGEKSRGEDDEALWPLWRPFIQPSLKRCQNHDGFRHCPCSCRCSFSFKGCVCPRSPVAGNAFGSGNLSRREKVNGQVFHTLSDLLDVHLAGKRLKRVVLGVENPGWNFG